MSDLNKRDYHSMYSSELFWGKIKEVGKKVGAKGIYYALILYFVLQKPEVPRSAKIVVISALGYFISPIDAIVDITPIVGYVDDISALIFAIGKVAIHIDKDVKDQAKKQMENWFNMSNEDLEKLI